VPCGATIQHFQLVHLSLNSEFSSERAKSAGLVKILTTDSFLNNLTIIKDVLIALRCLSAIQNLQSHHQILKDRCNDFRCEGASDLWRWKLYKTLAIRTTNTFKGVLIVDGKPSINAGQFMTAIFDELNYHKQVNSAGRSTEAVQDKVQRRADFILRRVYK